MTVFVERPAPRPKRSGSRFPARLAACLAFLFAAHVAHAEDPKQAAAKAIARAKEHHKAGRLPEALQELTIAYALDPQKDLLYGIAQLHVKLGHCPDAITFYQKYLAAKPDADSASKAQQAIIACYEKKSADPPPANPPPANPPPANPPPANPPPQPQVPIEIEPLRQPFYRDVLGDVLLGSGTVAIVAGVVIYAGARSKRADADDAATYPEFADKVDDARRARNLALMVGGVGAALVIGGVFKLSTHKSHHEHRLTVAPVHHGGAAVWSGRF